MSILKYSFVLISAFVSQQAVAEEPTAATSTTTSAVTASAGESATSVAKIPTNTLAPRKTKFSFITSSFANVQNTNEGTQPISALNQVRVDYKLTDTERLRLNQIFSNELGVNSDEKNSFVVGDLYLQYSRARLAMLPSEVEVTGSLRVTAPVSNASKQKNQVAALRGDIGLQKSFGSRFDLAAHFAPTYNYQTTVSYMADGARKANSPFNIMYYLAGSVNFTKSFNFAQEAGLMHYWMSADEANGISAKEKDFLYLDSSLNYTISDNFGVGVGLSSYLGRDLLDQKSQFAMYRADETDYYLTGSASF